MIKLLMTVIAVCLLTASCSEQKYEPCAEKIKAGDVLVLKNNERLIVRYITKHGGLIGYFSGGEADAISCNDLLTILDYIEK